MHGMSSTCEPRQQTLVRCMHERDLHQIVPAEHSQSELQLTPRSRTQYAERARLGRERRVNVRRIRLCRERLAHLGDARDAARLAPRRLGHSAHARDLCAQVREAVARGLREGLRIARGHLGRERRGDVVQGGIDELADLDLERALAHVLHVTLTR
jgi:hypothetical protein